MSRRFLIVVATGATLSNALVVSLGNLLGPPITGFFNEVIFPEVDGVRYSIICVTLLFGVIAVVTLQLARKPYAEAWEKVNGPGTSEGADPQVAAS